MPDLTGGQLIWDGTSGDFEIVTDVWWPEENGLTQLWFGNDLEGADTKIGPGDYIDNPTYWAPTRVQIPMWFQGHANAAGEPYENVIEGFESNLNHWRAELTDPSISAITRSGVLIMPSGEERTAIGSKFALTGNARRRPSGWPLMFEFTLKRPFTAASGS